MKLIVPGMYYRSLPGCVGGGCEVNDGVWDAFSPVPPTGGRLVDQLGRVSPEETPGRPRWVVHRSYTHLDEEDGEDSDWLFLNINQTIILFLL